MHPFHKKILSTKTLEPAVADFFQQAGYDLRQVPFIQVQAHLTEGQRSALTQWENQALGVIFTSVHGLKALLPHLSKRPSAWQVYCLDAATRKAAEENLGAHAVAGSAPTALDLAKVIEGKGTRLPLVFFCGELRRPDLVEYLRNRGIEIREEIVYTNRLVPTAIVELFSAVLFFSPSGVESYFSANQPHPGCTLFALGPTTAQALVRFWPGAIVVSPRPDPQVLAATAVRYLNQNLLTDPEHKIEYDFLKK